MLVLEFTRAVLESAADLPDAVHEIYRWYRTGERVLVLVPAIPAGADRLLAQALDRAGVPALVLEPHERSRHCPVLITREGFGRHTLRAKRVRRYESALHADALELAAAHSPGTRNAHRSLRVLLLGLGTVGFGVYQRLCSHTNEFQVIGALVRNPPKYLSLGVPPELLYTDPDYLRVLEPDVIVDALPGLQPSLKLLEHFLAHGISAVSANKHVIADQGAALQHLASKSGATLRYSAAVGGAAPMLETVTAAAARAPIASLAAVLNGTCNFVLDACAAGDALATAIARAQQAGFAEADPAEDLLGHDAARKLRILARAAFPEFPEEELPAVKRRVLDEKIAAAARDPKDRSTRLRQVARVARQGRKLTAQIALELVGATTFFGRLQHEWNGLEITLRDGKLNRASGRGAGRWPTTESVMADVWDLWRALPLRDSGGACRGERVTPVTGF